MTTTTRNEARIASNLRQIAALRLERDRIVNEFLSNGWDREVCQERCTMVSEQIQELYEEIDALEAGDAPAAHRYPVYHDETI